MRASPSPPRRARELITIIGPGVVAAATGVGAGDLVSAAKAGAIYGLPILWVAAVGALLKFVLAEGVARWQLATGTTLLEGWMRNFGWPVRVYFLVYLVIWTFVVSAALMSACGLAAHALVPRLSVGLWAALHAVAGLLFVWFQGYGVFERSMKAAIGVMFIAIVGTAVVERPAGLAVLRGLVTPQVPEGSTLLLLGVVGGVGGTLTLLSYSYWIREKGWHGPGWMRAARLDLVVGYLLTGIFGICLMILAAVILRPRGIVVEGSGAVVGLAQMLGAQFGRAGEMVFLAGFWAAVASSLLGVWQGVPYLFVQSIALLRDAESADRERATSTRGGLYRGYVVFMTFPPMLLLTLERPVWLIVAYAAIGSLFMPFLAATLLILNNRRKDLQGYRNGVLANAGLILCLVLFAYLAYAEIQARFSP